MPGGPILAVEGGDLKKAAATSSSIMVGSALASTVGVSQACKRQVKHAF